MKHKIFYRIFAIAFIVSAAQFASAQSPRTISLQEAITLSITNSKLLKYSHAKIDEATSSLKEAVERKLPNASLSGSYLRFNKPNIDIQVKSNNSSGGTSQNTGDPTSLSYGLANISLPVYSGFRIRYGIASSKYLAEAARLDADNDREDVILNTINAYDNLYKSRAAVDLVKENLESARQRVKDFSNLEKNGILPRNDLLKSELQASNTELSLLDAENNWKLANINMDLMLGLADTTVLSVTEGDLNLSSVQLKPVEDYIQFGLQNRKDIAALSLRKKAAATGVKAAHSEAYPSVALTGGYAAASVPSIFTLTNAVNIGLGVQLNLASLWKSGTIDQAKAREKQVSANEEMLLDAIRLQVNEAYQNYLLSLKKIEVVQTAVSQAEENYKIIKNKFDNALATTTDLLDADVARLQSRLNSAFAKADAAVAYSKLLQTAGQLDNTTK